MVTLNDVLAVQTLTPDDWRIWRQVRLAALVDAPQAFGAQLSDWTGEGDTEERWRGRLALERSRNVIALLAGAAVGMASGVVDSAAADCHVISMWVSPEERGRGVGDLVLQAIEEWASSSGARRLRLAVASGNPAAEYLYRRNGFQPTGEWGEVMPDGVHQEKIMQKPVLGCHVNTSAR